MPQSVIVLDAEIGGVSTNTFVDLPEMDILMHQKPNHSLWDLITDDDEKKAALVWASRVLSNLKWNGLIFSTTQKLSFPRTSLYDYDSREYASDAYPEWLTIACSELAFNFATADLLVDSETAGLKAVKLGSLAVTVDTEFKKELIPDYINNMIAPWLSSQYNSNTMSLSRT